MRHYHWYGYFWTLVHKQVAVQSHPPTSFWPTWQPNLKTANQCKPLLTSNTRSGPANTKALGPRVRVQQQAPAHCTTTMFPTFRTCPKGHCKRAILSCEFSRMRLPHMMITRSITRNFCLYKAYMGRWSHLQHCLSQGKQRPQTSGRGLMADSVRQSERQGSGTSSLTAWQQSHKRRDYVDGAKQHRFVRG